MNNINKYIDKHQTGITLLLFFAGYMIILPVLAGIAGTILHASKNAMMLSSIGIQMVSSLFILYINRDALKKSFKSGYAVKGIFYGAAAILLNFAFIFILMLLQDYQRSANDVAINEMLSQHMVPTIISSVIFAPVMEELVFRKCMHGWLNNRLNSSAIATAITSVIFASLHCIDYILMGEFSEIISILYYIIPSFVFQRAYNKTGDIRTAIIAHMVMNSFSMYQMLSLM